MKLEDVHTLGGIYISRLESQMRHIESLKEKEKQNNIRFVLNKLETLNNGLCSRDLTHIVMLGWGDATLGQDSVHWAY